MRIQDLVGEGAGLYRFDSVLLPWTFLVRYLAMTSMNPGAFACERDASTMFRQQFRQLCPQFDSVLVVVQRKEVPIISVH